MIVSERILVQGTAGAIQGGQEAAYERTKTFFVFIVLYHFFEVGPNYILCLFFAIPISNIRSAYKRNIVPIEMQAGGRPALDDQPTAP